MKIFKQFFTLLFVGIFFTQNIVQATSPQTPDVKMKIEKFVKTFNGMSNQGRIELLKTHLHQRTDIPQNIKQEKINLLSKLTIPELTMVKRGVTFTWQKQVVTITPVKKSIVQINGVEVDIGMGKFTQSLDQLELLFSKRSASFLDLFVSPAYADPILESPGVSLALLALCVGAAFAAEATMLLLLIGVPVATAVLLITELFKGSKKDQIESLCQDLRDEAKSIDNFSINEIMDLKSAISQAQNEIKADEECFSDEKLKTVCDRAESCLTNLNNDLSIILSTVNTNERNITKDQQNSTSKPKVQKDATAQ